ncbi:hypothetical protein CR492_03675 [Methylocella silvestris]|uniref:Glycosyl transferase family 1 domain-containing protein n=2 Tax=Methylocella silvestris TaxID=199596 RepID=A0A2J7TKA1_METSI|nr:hypothetical protein CR492_03675 [Methylocella silvestris]
MPMFAESVKNPAEAGDALRPARAPSGFLRKILPNWVRRRKAAPAQRERARDKDAPPRVIIDLTDVVCHAVWHDACAGIPRVQLEIARALLARNPMAQALGWHRNKWRDLGPLIVAADGDVDQIFALLKETFCDIGWNAKGARLALRRRRRNLNIESFAEAPDLRPQDALLIGGAFWLNLEIVNLCKDAAAKGANLVVLFHDLIPLSMPSFTGHDFAREYREMLSLPAHFVVTTEQTRSELKRARRRIDGWGGRISSTVTPLADEFPGSPRNEIAGPPPPRLAALSMQGFALCVGTIEIRKNHFLLMTAWEELAAERGGDMPKLVIAGRRGWKAQATLNRIDALEPDGPIGFIETPSDDELRWLYASCSFTVFPSLFEGWGLPVGESFWFGKPCAASNAQSIGPVARNLCSAFSPHHIDDMKSAIRRLLDADQRAVFQCRIEAAPLRTWSEFAAEIEALIAERRPMSDPLLLRESEESFAARAA